MGRRRGSGGGVLAEDIKARPKGVPAVKGEFAPSEVLGADGELLLRSVASAITGAAHPQVALLIPAASADWARLVVDNKLGVLVIKGLGREAERLPAPAREALEQARAKTIRANTASLLTLRRILPFLEQAGVQVAVFKGPVSQLGTYGGYFVKPSVDVDLLVAERDFNRARALLAQCGYELPRVCATPWWRNFLGEQPLLHTSSSLGPIDLHHKLQQPGCPSPRRLDRFLDKRRLLPVAGGVVPTVSPTHAVLVACISLAKGLVNRDPAGGHVADIAARLLVLDPAGVAALEAEARQQGLSGTLGLGLQAARALFGVTMEAPHARDPLGVGDAELVRLVLTPHAPSALWPRRRQLLRGLCDGHADFLRELALLVVGELCRRLYEPRVATLARAAP